MPVRPILIACATTALAACASQPATPSHAPRPAAPPPAVSSPAPAASVAPALPAIATQPAGPPAPPAHPATPETPARPVVPHASPAPPRPPRMAGHAHAASSHSPHPAPRHHGGHTLQGTVQLSATDGQAVRASDYRHTVIYFVPERGHYKPRPVQATIYTHHRDFDPDWLALPLGSTVTFTNLDQVAHNVFSVTPGSSFDLGYEHAQQSVAHRFDHAGMVLISCHVHRYMRGNILVVPTRYATRAGSNGRFRLRHLPAVPGTLYFWNPRTSPVTRRVASPSGTIQQHLVIDQPAVKTQIDLGSGS